MSDQLDIFGQPLPAEETGCVCAEINTRHCPVHGQDAQEPSRGQMTDLPGETWEDAFGGA